jgi:hypothetical protein
MGERNRPASSPSAESDREPTSGLLSATADHARRRPNTGKDGSWPATTSLIYHRAGRRRTQEMLSVPAKLSPAGRTWRMRPLETQMAVLKRDGEDLVVELSAFEKAEAIHGDLRLPFSSVSSIDIVEDALAAVHGLRAPGTGVPGVLAIGTFRDRGTKLFAVVHHGRPGGVRVTLKNSEFDEVVIGCDDPGAVVAALQHLG